MTYYDGQGFMVPRSRNVASALELGGSKVCVQKDTTTELNLADYFRANNMAYEARSSRTVDDALKALRVRPMRRADQRHFAALCARLRLGKPGDHVILPDIISKEPLAPAVRRDDDWLLLVKWMLFAMLNAEELGVNSKNIDEALKSEKPDVRRFVGTDGDLASSSACPMTGRCASSATSATTARSMSAMSAPAPSSAFRAASTSSGTPAASNTRRRSARSIGKSGPHPRSGPKDRVSRMGPRSLRHPSRRALRGLLRMRSGELRLQTKRAADGAAPYATSPDATHTHL